MPSTSRYPQFFREFPERIEDLRVFQRSGEPADSTGILFNEPVNDIAEAVPLHFQHKEEPVGLVADGDGLHAIRASVQGKKKLLFMYPLQGNKYNGPGRERSNGEKTRNVTI